MEEIVNDYLLNWTINKNREIEDKNTEKRTLLKEATEEKDKIKIGMRKENEMAKFTTNYDAHISDDRTPQRRIKERG